MDFFQMETVIFDLHKATSCIFSNDLTPIIIQALVIVFTVAGLAMVKLPGFKAFLGRLTERRKEAA